MKFFWDYLSVALPLFLLLGLFGVLCGYLARRITNGGEFGRGMDALVGGTIGVLLGSLIGLIADILGVEEFFPFKVGPIGLETHLVCLTVSSVALVFLMKWLARKERSINAGEHV